jgi:hypothetical protein
MRRFFSSTLVLLGILLGSAHRASAANCNMGSVGDHRSDWLIREDAVERGLARAPYVPIFGATIAGDEAIYSARMDRQVRCLVSKLGRPQDTTKVVEVVVDGFEDSTDYYVGIREVEPDTEVSLGVFDEHVATLRGPLAKARARRVAEAIHDRLPWARVVLGRTFVLERKGMRGAVAYVRVRDANELVDDDSNTTESRESDRTAFLASTSGAEGFGKGTASIGVNAGYASMHRTQWGLLGAAATIDPEWWSGLSFDGSFNIQLAQDPVWVSELKPETRITRGIVDARWAFVPSTRDRDADGRSFTPFIAAGAFFEPDIAVGPWFGAGATRRIEWMAIDVMLGLSVFPIEKEGNYGVELLVRPRLLRPLG